MSKSIPLFEVFRVRAHGVQHILRFACAGAMAFEGIKPEDYIVDSKGDGTELWYTSPHDKYAHIVFSNIKAAGVSGIKYGTSTVTKEEQIGSNEQIVDNRDGVADVEVKFSDLFSETDSKEDSKSAGTSVSVTVESQQNIEGFASFDESVTAEAHAEMEESEGHSTTHEDTGEEGTTVPKGKRVRIVETRSKASGEIPVSARGDFTFSMTIGHHGSHGWHSGTARFDSWQQFCDVITRNAPDNYPLAKYFKDHPPYHADLWALNPLDSEVRYIIKFEGRVMRTYSVQAF